MLAATRCFRSLCSSVSLSVRPASHPAARNMASTSSSSASAFKVPTIQLDNQESAVLDLIDDFTKHLATSRNDLPAVECRVAGGWVRDKVSSTYTRTSQVLKYVYVYRTATWLRLGRSRHLYIVIDRASFCYTARRVPPGITASCIFVNNGRLDAKHKDCKDSGKSRPVKASRNSENDCRRVGD